MRKNLYLVMAIALLVGLAAPAALAQQETPTRHKLVDIDDTEVRQTEHLMAPSSGTVSVVVHLAKESLARAGADMEAGDRAAYAGAVAALQNEVSAQINALEGTVVGRFRSLSSGLAVEIDASKLDELRDLPDVIDVRLVHDYQMDLSDTVPWIGAAAVQDLGYDGSGVKVAVLDSGVDYTHAKLGGPGTTEAYAAAYCGDPTAAPDPTDPDCDAHDFADLTGLFPSSKVVGGYDFVGDQWPDDERTSDPNPIDFEGHGTHVADIIAGLPQPGPAQARVRVAHLSPDAPSVDILVNDGVAFADVAFQEITTYATLPSGTYNVKVVPAGATEPVVIEADLTLAQGVDYTVAAVNVLAEIEPLVLMDDNTPPAVGNAHVRFLHASADAPAVDIAVADGGPVLFSDVEFKEVGGYLPVAAGTYDLEVRLAGTDTVVLPLPGIALEAGTIYTAYAVGLVADGSLTAIISLDTPRAPDRARIRVAHLSPDAPSVDILVNDGAAFADVAFQEITTYATLPSGTYNVKVVPAGATEPVVIEADLTLKPGTDHTVAAVNVLAEIEPLVLMDDNTPPAVGNAHVRFLHASADAPAVDIAVADGGPVLFGDVEFKEVGGYLPVAAGTYDLEVRLAGTDTVVLPLPGIALEAGTIYTAYAVGLVADGSLTAIVSVDYDGSVGSGVAPGADIYAFKVCSSISSACNGLSLLLAMDAAADLDGDPETVDPADVVNMSLGAIYGQPEDDLTYFSNEITALGTIVVAAAGNASDKPYIADSPSSATAAVSVAQTTVPSDAIYKIRRNTPAPELIIDEAVFQGWSAPLTAEITADVVYGDGDGSNLTGCDPFTSDLTGKVSLVDRGDCFFSAKVQNAEAAGAVLSIIVQSTPDPPFPGGFGGGDVPTIPGFMIWQADGDLLKEDGTNITMDPEDSELIIPIPDTIIGGSARGPRQNDNYIKPDIAAPGASISAEVGTGTGTTAFGGTSGATPMVAGTAALLKQKYGGQPLPGNLTDLFGDEMPVWMYKSLLMNTGEDQIWLDQPEGTLAPITRIGGGRVDALSAFGSGTVAWDETDAWRDTRYRTGSLSFGYEPVNGQYSEHRYVAVANLSEQDLWYTLSSALRYAEDEGKGVSLAFTNPYEPDQPDRLYVPAQSHKWFLVTLTVDAENLPPWDVFGFGKGSSGADGSALTEHEYDGYITIDGGENNTVHLPWHILPKRAAQVQPAVRWMWFGCCGDQQELQLANSDLWQDGDVDVFSLVEKSPNVYNYKVINDLEGACASAGLDPGCNETRIDLKEVGVRHLPVLLDVFPEGLVEFGLTIWDCPYRASQFPAAFDVYIDSPADGLGEADADGATDDFLVENNDLGLLTGAGVDGRNVVAVFDLAAEAGSIWFFTDSGFNTQNWILTVPASELGLEPGAQFRFRVEAWDSYFNGDIHDCSPGDCESYHTYTAGVPKYAVDEVFPTVPANDQITLKVTQVADGKTASPSQIGLLLMYRQAPLYRESNAVLVWP